MAGGNATDGQVLAGRTYSNAGGPGTGSMTNNGAVTLTPTTTNVAIAAGYHDGGGYVMGDTDLISGNIKSGVNLFGVDGTLTGGSTYNAGVPKTGQTTSYASGDDGDMEAGIAWPSPRFTDNGDGTVTDNMTGLIWLKDADCFTGPSSWSTALSRANGVANGSCGLTDGSSAGDWRLPNVLELHSLIDFSRYNPSLPTGHPFTGVWATDYWTSTTTADDSTRAFRVNMYRGLVSRITKTSGPHYTWPVRGGQ